MSQEGYDKLVAELKQLESVERPKASAAIAEARDKGDLSENAEYDAAKEAQAHLEEKINRIRYPSPLLSHRACSTTRWATRWKSRFRAELSICVSTRLQ